MRTLARLLPVLLALAIPYFTPGIRHQGPSIGAGWLQAEPARWGGQTVSVLAFLPHAAPLPGTHSQLRTEGLQSHRRSPFDQAVTILARMSPEGTTLLVEGSFFAKDPTRGRFAAQMGIGLVLLVLLPLVCVRRDGNGEWQARSWIR